MSGDPGAWGGRRGRGFGREVDDDLGDGAGTADDGSSHPRLIRDLTTIDEQLRKLGDRFPELIELAEVGRIKAARDQAKALNTLLTHVVVQMEHLIDGRMKALEAEEGRPPRPWQRKGAGDRPTRAGRARGHGGGRAPDGGDSPRGLGRRARGGPARSAPRRDAWDEPWHDDFGLSDPDDAPWGPRGRPPSW